ncbi:MAG: glycosyl transferase family 90 [Marinifilaceae bacterium]|jgi:hypothetical protein|nr:glycosyl transferase family 90 [Marinifilaceae bacterium]
MNLKRMSWKHKNNKALYYSRNYLMQLWPSIFCQKSRGRKLMSLDKFDLDYIRYRVNYYNKLDSRESIDTSQYTRLADMKMPKKHKVYYMDLYEYSRYFDQNLKGLFLYGDVVHTPEIPGLVKSRPISEDNVNSVVLKWDKIRHFTYINNDPYKFEEKENILIGRGKVHPHQPHRTKFMEMYKDHPMCDIGKVNYYNGKNPEWNADRITISDHLKYKFIMSLEGTDVASNLKWVMSSNSLPVMPKPKFETWFMEDTLIPDYHYLAINEEYTDLEERLNYYIENTDKANEIIKNAHEYVAQFRNKEREDLISLLVLEKFFYMTGQIDKISDQLKMVLDH